MTDSTNCKCLKTGARTSNSGSSKTARAARSPLCCRKTIDRAGEPPLTAPLLPSSAATLNRSEAVAAGMTKPVIDGGTPPFGCPPRCSPLLVLRTIRPPDTDVAVHQEPAHDSRCFARAGKEVMGLAAIGGFMEFSGCRAQRHSLIQCVGRSNRCTRRWIDRNPVKSCLRAIRTS